MLTLMVSPRLVRGRVLVTNDVSESNRRSGQKGNARKLDSVVPKPNTTAAKWALQDPDFQANSRVDPTPQL